jgi:hypothetical protein
MVKIKKIIGLTLIVLFHTIFSYKTKRKLKDIEILGNLTWDKNQKKIVSDINKGRYIEGLDGLPIIDINNKCFDGNHRLTALKQVHGEDHIVLVKKSLTTIKFILRMTIWYTNKSLLTLVRENQNLT